MITTKLRIKTPATKSFSIRDINKYSKNDLKCFGEDLTLFQNH
jgi:hypothetical protein